jgi:hypothetical protein
MQRGASGHIVRGLAVAVFATSVAACVTADGRTGLAHNVSNATVAFESIDGAPPAVFQTLVAKLNEEAVARQVPVVTREGFAPYRIRGYVAAIVVDRQTVVSWVWDVYDREARRAARLTGEEKAGPAGREPWAAANEAVLARVARSGMEQLVTFLKMPAAPAAPSDHPDRRPAVAMSDDFGPERHGIFRLPQPAPVAADAGRDGVDAPLPPRRPPDRRDRIATATSF